VAAIVRTDVTTTAASAHHDHLGQDNLRVSSAFAMASEALQQDRGSVD
jgi:hypothetical protein